VSDQEVMVHAVGELLMSTALLTVREHPKLRPEIVKTEPGSTDVGAIEVMKVLRYNSMKTSSQNALAKG
jgi:hypothetical protein